MKPEGRIRKVGETFLSELPAAGEPKQEIIPDLIPCLIKAHQTVSESARARIEQLLAAQLRQQHAAKLNPPQRKPWWKAW